MLPYMTINNISKGTSTSSSVHSIKAITTMKGVGSVGGRALFEMDTEVALGGWANALKGLTKWGTTGRVTGLGSAVVAEMTMGAGCTQGTYAPLEIELNMGSAGVCGTMTALWYMSVNDAAATVFDDNGYLFALAGVTAGSGHVFEASTKTGIAKTHTLRINVGGTAYYIPLHTSSACGGS